MRNAINNLCSYKREVLSGLSRIKHFGKIASTLQNLSEITAVFLDKKLQKYPNFRVLDFLYLFNTIKNDDLINFRILIKGTDPQRNASCYLRNASCYLYLELTPKSLQIKYQFFVSYNPGRIGGLKDEIELLNSGSPERIIKENFIKKLNFLGIYDDIYPEAYHSEIEIGIEEACRMSVDEFIYYLDKTFQKMLPLMLIYMPDDPLPGICKYLNFQPLYSLVECAVNTGFKEEKLERWVKIIKRKKQVIFQGPPGTGKTFIAKEIAKHLIGGTECGLPQAQPVDY